MLPKTDWVRTRVMLDRRVEPFDWQRWFGRVAPRVLDLGCGNGLYLVSSALRRSTHDHLGVELVPPALRLASLRAGQRGLSHCKFAWGDATEFVVSRCPSASVDEVHLYHPQPYYDAAKLDRRQLAPHTLLAIWRVLVPGGLFVFQTDNPAYWKWTGEHAPQLFEWSEHAEPWPDAPAGRTLREIRARAQGLAIFRAVARRRELDAGEADARAARMSAPTFDANKFGAGRFRPGKRSARPRDR
ncbi:MAG: methyltransferase domain-containing protein [Planctomycetota bacterium]|nr:MAG: methyltransferase domain-containing protein [Planctomycetota bacterium]